MIWLSWRQLRIQAAAAAVGVVVAAIVLAVTGPPIARLTGNIFDQLTQLEFWLYSAGIVVLAVTPAVLGAFLGAPLVAREVEAGTHRLAWTQSVSRGRWLATKLALALTTAAATMGVLALAVTWWADPLDAAQSQTHGSLPSRMTPVAFDMRGIVPVAYGVFAVALGVAVGAVVRRSVAAMAITLAVYVLVTVAVPVWVRPHLIPPVSQTLALGNDTIDGVTMHGEGPNAPITVTAHTANAADWVLTNRTLDPSGRAVDKLPSWFEQCLPSPPPVAAEKAGAAAARNSLDSCLQRLSSEGYRQQLIYQPANRFWSLQWAETGVFLVASGLLAWFSFWWVRRRLT